MYKKNYRRNCLALSIIGFIVGIILCLQMGCATGLGGLSQPPDGNEILAARNQNCPIAFSTIHAERNTVDGIDVMVTWKNISNKTIKYCYMVAYFKNAVGDRVTGFIRGRKLTPLRFTGPFAPGQIHWGGGSGYHSTVIYHENAKTIHIEYVQVKFMDGSQTKMIPVDGLISSYGEIKLKYRRGAMGDLLHSYIKAQEKKR